MEIKIEKGVVPPKERINWKELITGMEIGDSVLLPIPSSQASPALASYRKQGYKVTFRKEGEDSCRMWLLSKPRKKGGK